MTNRFSFSFSKSLRDVSSHLALDNVNETVEVTPGLRKHLRDTIGQCYKMCFEHHKDAMKLVSLSGSCKAQVAERLLSTSRFSDASYDYFGGSGANSVL